MRNNLPMSTVLLTGAAGFVGRHLYPALVAAGHEVRTGTRRPQVMARAQPDWPWIELDLERPETLAQGLAGVDAAVYLVHSMAEAGDYEARERAAATCFAAAAGAAGLRRIVYLGGATPAGRASKHLRSRKITGEILRSGPVPTIELRAGMIVGAGSESWRIVRDLAVRLPVMILPKWLASRSQPIAIEDVVAAIVHAVGLPAETVGASAVLDLPGPEILSGEEILRRVAAILGVQPLTVHVPVLSPRLSSYWLRLVTRADFRIARQLVEGLRSDLLASDEGFWRLMPEYGRTPFDVAARRALEHEEASLSPATRTVEAALHRVSRSL